MRNKDFSYDVLKKKEDITIVNIYASNTGVCQYVRQMWQFSW